MTPDAHQQQQRAAELQGEVGAPTPLDRVQPSTTAADCKIAQAIASHHAAERAGIDIQNRAEAAKVGLLVVRHPTLVELDYAQLCRLANVYAEGFGQ